MARRLGHPLMPWQQLVADVGTEIDPDTGVFAYREVRFVVPRQNGKTQLVLSWECHRALAWPTPQRIVYSAQTGNDARKKLLEDQVPMLEKPAMASFIRQINKGIGNESVSFHNNSILNLQASTETSGHGRTTGLAVIDEAWADTDSRREQAMNPSMMTVEDAQQLICSTAGTDVSLFLRRKVDDGRSFCDRGINRDVAYFEWSADEKADPDDPATWWACMPALGYTITEQTVRTARLTLTDSDFRRAYLNQWTASDERIISAVTWETVQTAVKVAESGLCFGIDVDPERSVASIGSAGRADSGDLVVELVDQRSGVGWLVERAAELSQKWWAPVVVDSAGPAANFIPDLQRVGVRVVGSGIATPKGYDSFPKATAVCSDFYDDVADRKVWVRRHGGLDAAVAGATKRSVGDAWVWARKDAGTDVCPLWAVTLALAGVKSAGGAVAQVTVFDDDDFDDDE